MLRIVRSIVFIALGVFVLGWVWSDAQPRPIVVEVTDVVGHEEPQAGLIFTNGFNVGNFGEAKIADAFERYETFLGEPVSSFDGRCQAFRFGRLCYQPANPSDWRIEFSNLGLDDLQIQGYSPKPGSSPHPAVRDWLVNQLEAGTDLMRLVGRIISDPLCDRRTGECRQWAEKQAFLFDASALTWDKVQRAPLGLWLTHTRTRPAVISTGDRNPNVVALIIGVVLVLVGLATTRDRSDNGSSQPV